MSAQTSAIFKGLVRAASASFFAFEVEPLKLQVDGFILVRTFYSLRGDEGWIIDPSDRPTVLLGPKCVEMDVLNTKTYVFVPSK